LPFLSTLAPSERYAKEQGKRHKKLTEWTWQLLLLVRSWHPEHEIIAVADRTYASLKLLDRCRKLRNPITFVSPAFGWTPPSTSRPCLASRARRDALASGASA
jgi:hypothetical protein